MIFGSALPELVHLPVRLGLLCHDPVGPGTVPFQRDPDRGIVASAR
jgi:hypothetical protein